MKKILFQNMIKCAVQGRKIMSQPAIEVVSQMNKCKH